MDEEFLAVIVICGILFGGIFGLAFLGSSIQCKSQWERSGFESDWGPIQGCMIRIEGNKWIPDESYREINQ